MPACWLKSCKYPASRAIGGMCRCPPFKNRRGINFQNAIKPSDLMSNDRRQIEIEPSFRKLGYIYLRKRQSKGDASRSLGGKRYIVIKSYQELGNCSLFEGLPNAGFRLLLEPILAGQSRITIAQRLPTAQLCKVAHGQLHMVSDRVLPQMSAAR